MEQKIVIFFPYFTIFSEAVKGCYPLNGTLPGVLAALVPAARCDLSPEEGDSTVLVALSL
jgi:hypothetical protein